MATKKQPGNVARDPRSSMHELDATTQKRAASKGRRRQTWNENAKNVLTVFGVEADPNYHYRIVNDDPTTGQLQKKLDLGYEFVNAGNNVQVGDKDANSASNVGNVVSKIVGPDRNGDPMRAYLLRIPKEFFEEDQEAKMAAVDKADNLLRSEWQEKAPSDKKHQNHIRGTFNYGDRETITPEDKL